MKVINIFLLLVLMLPIMSANGLVIEGNNSFNISKIVNVDKEINFIIKNTDSFSFYNITFEDNNYIEMPKINELQSGASANITAIVKTNENIDKDIKIIGSYWTTIGSSNQTYQVVITYDNGLDPCDFSIIKGDKVNWSNLANRDVKLINSQTGSEITNIQQDKSFMQEFSAPMNLIYHGEWFGFTFTNDCTITILDDTGYVHNPEYDATIHLKTNVNYEPTNLTATFLKDNYSMEFYDEEEGLFLIENVGTKDAKNINIEGDWFSFTPNNFNLNAGSSKTISYKINPEIQYTNQTNKTYTKTLTISGNFNTIKQNISIFIKYADIDSGNYSESDNLLKIIENYCKENPDVCGGKTKVIIRDKNDSKVNVTVASEQLRQIFEYIYSKSQDDKEYQNYMKTKMNNFSLSVIHLETNQLKSSQDIFSLKEMFDNANSFVMFLIIGINFIIILGLGGFVVYYVRKKKKMEKLRRMA